MHFPSLRAIPTAVLAAGAQRGCRPRRQFHASARRCSGLGNSGRPSEESATEHNGEVEVQGCGEASGGRSRATIASSLRSRQARRKPASALPPVELPNDFLEYNVTIYEEASQPRLPPALAEDAKREKVSRLFLSPSADVHASNEVIQNYFETAIEKLLLRNCELAVDFTQRQTEEDKARWESPEMMAKVVRTWDMILDASWHLADALYPARQAEYVYKKTPFWWWHIHKDFDHRTNAFRDQFVSLGVSLDHSLTAGEHLDVPLSHALAGFHVDTFVALESSIARELKAKAPSNFDAKTGKRPLNILSLSGYGGKAIAQSIATQIAHGGFDLIHLDAQDLSVLVGEYLGQHWAYSRGAVSMMGFRAAELSGKLVQDPEIAIRQASEDDEMDSESVLSSRIAAAGNLEEELHKLKQGGLDCFGKWDALKVDKILDHILQSARIKEPLSSRPVLLHLHDIVELSMTLEGSFILARLRALADTAWQNGTQIAIFATSSSENPSDEYQNAVRDLAFGEFVVSRHLQPYKGNIIKSSKKIQGELPADLQTTDYFFENIENIRRMMQALQPNSQATTESVEQTLLEYLRSANTQKSTFKRGILPIPEVYHLAQALNSNSVDIEGSARSAFMERFIMGPLRPQAGQRHLDEEVHDPNPSAGETMGSNEDVKSETTRAPAKLNEYEKRIQSGLINKENLRTTFGDVHVPPETITALKLLTSLALVRPDAFSYGILAADKIPGCLLYGPPGTGKTMLAKAVAKESGANMLEISGATINDKWVGESEKLIRAVFTLAKKYSPCVVFIDEADSLLANRSMFSNRPSHREHINQFLKEWDGMEETNAFIMVATNRPFDLDDAVLRRLPRKLLVDLPLRDDRAAILKLLLRDETLDDTVSIDEYAEKTPYYSGSDLKNVCVAAAMAAVEEENEMALKHTGEVPFAYPEKRILRKTHFENALKQIPASISEDMMSLKMIRKFDEEYGNRRRAKKKSMGFGILDEKLVTDAHEARIRK
ncbi:mitochondrial AAA ATPase, putative [Cordyceps militaris CM01]|uniref:Mitochondrial AAA ATPase, putative n=1 Tax=Cordyceps militaris (strain CM01) TaxID=983644 RepID=G3JPS5_CORMM|nr:mitochondrial AAA ATPase, putative [Cordyceps militaris CM01]EGX89176.1 mitochondrial AAA ATPase, putative [Cordyceps militaris CM01]